ncbi:DUF4062 domain-containing protein [Anaerosalibacter sp. Marseille-P3206]|uniref:DUF4062 domain-containing protein n=1 Tax=Anaerosalibacter sp. Marseille-P3206 TaxID=1871005 RepID=UPI00135640C4|nr:DUF4062 domain-containing protein [Anaerosalibacter sp. Marseille-P3206]
MGKIKVMLSSTVQDLEEERKAVKSVFDNIEFIELIGVDPVNDSSYGISSRMKTAKMARDCDLYLLILGKEFGLELPSGKSATEIEFDEAMRDDPTKILVFKENYESSGMIDQRQKDFIDKVCNYYSGYWRSTFQNIDELRQLVLNSFVNWIKERADIGENLNYLDHFVRIAKQMKPEPNATVCYKLAKDFVELEYGFFGKTCIMHFDREKVYKDFWGCISELQEQFEIWIG